MGARIATLSRLRWPGRPETRRGNRGSRYGRSRLAIDALSLVGLILVLFVGHVAASDGVAYDAHAYWLASGYRAFENTPDAFVYSPPILLVCRMLSQLPWQVFLEIYTGAIGVGVWILAGPVTPFVVFTPQVATEITLANIHVFLALVAVFGLRWPALWSFALLTKVTPGIGILWFAFRGEWRKLWVAIGATVAIALPTVLLAPNLWADWIGVLAEASGQSYGLPLAIRLPLAVALLWLGARRNWPWLVPVASMLALPILWDVHGLSMLLGVVWWASRPLVARSDPISAADRAVAIRN